MIELSGILSIMFKNVSWIRKSKFFSINWGIFYCLLLILEDHFSTEQKKKTRMENVNCKKFFLGAFLVAYGSTQVVGQMPTYSQAQINS